MTRDMVKKIHTIFLILFLQLSNTVMWPAEPGQAVKFETISLEHELSQVSVNYILQDKYGFIWFGTQDGLNRYDGYGMTVFRTNEGEPLSISDNHVRVMVQDNEEDFIWVGTYSGGLSRYDQRTGGFTNFRHKPGDPSTIGFYSVFSMFQEKNGILWLGTWGGGLDRFNKNDGEFTHHRHDPSNPHSISHNIVRSIYRDRGGILWVGTYGGGLNRFEEETGRFFRYSHDPDNPASLSHNQVMVIYETRAGEMWIGTDGGGLNRFNRESGVFEHFLNQPGEKNSLAHNRIRAIHEDRNGNLWVGTYGGGLSWFDRQTGSFTNYRFNPLVPGTLADDQILSIMEDNSGILWIGTFAGGVSKLDNKKWKFKQYYYLPGSDNSLNFRKVRAFHEDPGGILWIGTNGGGLNRLDRKTNRYSYYRHYPGEPYSLAHDRIYALHQDKNPNILWVGTFDGGLDKLDKRTGRFTHYRHEPGNPNSPGLDRIRDICEDRRGRLWLGLWRGGLDRFEPQSGKFVHYKHKDGDPGSLSYDNVYSVYEDHEGVIWVATWGGGLNRLNIEYGTFTHYRADPTNPNSLSEDKVMTIYEDRLNRMWLGTGGGGLNLFDRKNNNWTIYTTKHGLPSNAINGILEDENGHLWISTNYGLSRFDPESGVFSNYDSHDGLQSNEFTGRACYKSSSGEMFFGGLNGFNSFFPARVKGNDFIPPVYITGFNKFHRPVIFSRPIYEIERIDLSYSDNFISFDFVALNYCSTEKNQYRYKLEGFDKQWIDSGTRRTAYYTNLPGGTYTFRVKGSNNDGKWNEDGTSVLVVITPPFWQTLWFKISIPLILLGGLGLFFFIWLNRVRRKNKHLELINARLNKEVFQRRQIEKALQASEEKYRSIVENSIDVHYRADMEGKLTMVNPAGVKLLRYDNAAEMLGQGLAETFYYEPKNRRLFLAAMKKFRKVVNFENKLKCKDGNTVDIEVSSQYIYDENGKPAGVEGIIRDISLRKQAEDENVQLQNQLLSAKKMEAVGTLAGGMAHEFNNLMAVIEGNAHLVMEGIGDENGLSRAAAAIVKAADRCTTLTNQLLSFSKKQMLKLKEVNLNDLVTGLTGSIRRLAGSQIKVVKQLEPEPGRIKVDAQLMRQVIIGIIENACDAMPDGGTLSIRTETVDIPENCREDNPEKREGKFVRLTIIDTGIGMDEETRQHMFEPFFTTKEVGQGTGLDLSFVYGTVTQHDGWICVDTAPGEGTSIKVFLPVFK